VAELEEELARRAAWAHGLEAEAKTLHEQLAKLEEQQEMLRSSSWIKLGRKTRMGPAV
jgi:hypothetical protein